MAYYFVILVLYLNLKAQELVKNSSFEDIQGDQPLYWNLYLEPEEGTFGKIDKTTSYSGNYSVLLNHSKPYKREPLNNWNQRISVPNNLKKVLLNGHIKTKDATQAYFLVQFWNDMGKIINSYKSEGIKGTHDWVSLGKELFVPAGTSFIMVRCILEGVGTAWFDDISLKEVSDENFDSDSEDLRVVLEKIDKLEKEISNIRGEYLYLRNRIDELEKRLYKIIESSSYREVNNIEKSSPEVKKKEDSLPRGITLEGINK